MITNVQGKHVDAGGLLAGASVLSRPAEEFKNNESIEYLWAEKAFDYSVTHYNILCSVDTKFLHLTPVDDDIYEMFRREFPNLRVDVLDIEYIKSAEQKKKWRQFCDQFKDTVFDYNFGSLLRIDCNGKYNEENTVLVPRIQFYAIEIARNKEDMNNRVKEFDKIVDIPVDGHL